MMDGFSVLIVDTSMASLSRQEYARETFSCSRFSRCTYGRDQSSERSETFTTGPLSLIVAVSKCGKYGAQNEAYMSRSAEKWVRGLCFNELGVCGLNDGVKRSVYIGLHLVYFWGLLRLLWFTWGLRVVYIAFLLVVGVVLGWGRMVAEATFFYGVSEFLYCEIIPYNDYLVYLQKQNE